MLHCKCKLDAASGRGWVGQAAMNPSKDCSNPGRPPTPVRTPPTPVRTPPTPALAPNYHLCLLVFAKQTTF